MENIEITRKGRFEDFIEFSIEDRKYLVLTSTIIKLIQKVIVDAKIFDGKGSIKGKVSYVEDSDEIVLTIGENNYSVPKIRIGNLIPKSVVLDKSLKLVSNEQPMIAKENNLKLILDDETPRKVSNTTLKLQKFIQYTTTPPNVMKCEIFREDSDNILINNEGIRTLGIYYPMSKIELHNRFSSRILIVKGHGKKETQKTWEIIEYFTNEIKKLLRDDIEFVICVVPSHNLGLQPSGIRAIAQKLCMPPIIDGTNVIERIKKMQEKHLGGERKLIDEKQSLSIVRPELIEKRPVLLIDDVTTTGISLRAAKELLIDEGARYVAAFALGKTYYIS